MTLFDQIVVKCPHCNTLMRDYELMSYTTHGSNTYFSDGMCDDIGTMSGSGEISICDQCNKKFWRSDARLERDTVDAKTIDELPGTHDIHDLHLVLKDDGDELRIKFYNDLIEQDFAGDDWQEQYLRTRLWWAINDVIRNLAGWRAARNLGQLSSIINHRRKSKKLFREYSGLLVQNLDRLIFLYIKGADVDLLYLANMYREKSDFSKAKDILNKYEGRKGHQYKAIKRKVKYRDPLVFKL